MEEGSGPPAFKNAEARLPSAFGLSGTEAPCVPTHAAEDDFSDYDDEQPTPVIVVLDEASGQHALQFDGMEVDLPLSGGAWQVRRDPNSKECQDFDWAQASSQAT